MRQENLNKKAKDNIRFLVTLYFREHISFAVYNKINLLHILLLASMLVKENLCSLVQLLTKKLANSLNKY